MSSNSNYGAIFRLHKEICDFYEFVRPKLHEEQLRQDIINRLSDILVPEFAEQGKRVRLCCFGSFASGLYLPTADMDLVLLADTFERTKIKALNNRALLKAARALERAGLCSGRVITITRARVPIIKFVDRLTNIHVDISFDNLTGVVANQTFQEWKQQFPALPQLIAIIKQFLLMRDLNDAATGGLGGFSITCLVTSLLQHHPAVQSGKMIPEHHLGELLIEFFDLYGNKFNKSTTGIMMRPPGYFPKVSQLLYCERLAD
jgi:non-canonical poly(A) RNA polymerase PAPD5/7